MAKILLGFTVLMLICTNCFAGANLTNISETTKYLMIGEKSQVWPYDSDLEYHINKLQKEIKDHKSFYSRVIKIHNQIGYYIAADILGQRYLWPLSHPPVEKPITTAKKILKRMNAERRQILQELKLNVSSSAVWDFYSKSEALLNGIIIAKGNPERIEKAIRAIDIFRQQTADVREAAQKVLSREELARLLEFSKQVLMENREEADKAWAEAEKIVHRGASIYCGSLVIQ